MDEERKRELEEEEKNRSPDEERLFHIAAGHVTVAMLELVTALSETEVLQAHLIREHFQERIADLIEDLTDLTEEIYDRVPGIMTLDEAEVLIDKEAAELTEKIIADRLSQLPPPERFH